MDKQLAADQNFPSRDDLLAFLRDHEDGGDREHIHKIADDLILGYINDEEISEAFNRMNNWYAS